MYRKKRLHFKRDYLYICSYHPPPYTPFFILQRKLNPSGAFSYPKKKQNPNHTSKKDLKIFREIGTFRREKSIPRKVSITRISIATQGNNQPTLLCQYCKTPFFTRLSF